MPQYDYICPECGNKEEVEMSMKEVGNVIPTCSKCGVSMEQRVTVGGIVFRGAGFYKTDS